MGKKSVTKRDLAVKIAENYNLSQVTVKKVIQQLIDEIGNILAENGRLELRRFGVFLVKQRKGRPARNPKTGEPVMVPPHKAVVFKGSAQLLKKIKKSSV